MMNSRLKQCGDAELIAKVKQGDEKAFDEIVRRYQWPLYRIAMRYVRCRNEAQDIVQECFIKVHQKLDQFRGEASLFSWCYRVVVNIAKNHLQSRQYRVRDHQDLHAMQELTDESSGPESLIILQQTGNVVANVIHSLPNSCKEAYQLRELSGHSYQAIADIQECPIGTVRSRLAKVRAAVELQLSA